MFSEKFKSVAFPEFEGQSVAKQCDDCYKLERELRLYIDAAKALIQNFSSSVPNNRYLIDFLDQNGALHFELLKLKRKNIDAYDRVKEIIHPYEVIGDAIIKSEFT